MHLLKKMGWEPGQGLGRNNEGNTAPLMLTLKFDTKGLASSEDKRKSKHMKPIVSKSVLPLQAGQQDNSSNNQEIYVRDNEILNFINSSVERNGHPVSILQELCSKYGFSSPEYEMLEENGPAHRPTFLMQVTINKIKYVPSYSSSSKKQAKLVAAQVCLQSMADFNGLPPANKGT